MGSQKGILGKTEPQIIQGRLQKERKIDLIKKDRKRDRAKRKGKLPKEKRQAYEALLGELRVPCGEKR